MGGGLSMALFSPKAWLRAQLAPYLSAIKKAVAAAAVGWPLVDSDPASPAVGAPWLLQTDLLGAVPIGVRSGFNRLTVVDQQSIRSAVLSVKTADGRIARFAATSLE